MGINVNAVRFLLYAKSQGVDFSTTATIGRQRLHLTFEQFRHVLVREFKYEIDDELLRDIFNHTYCERFLEFLGAREVHSFDYSDYENATHVHDFNLPLSQDYAAKYSAVIEGGTLEHIFNVPVGIRNCMQLLTVGGHYLGMSPTNNYMGHGFYQFSPELYFRAFSEQNGFRMRQMIMHEGTSSNRWFKVPDPDELGQRVGLINSAPILLLILAVKFAEISEFLIPFQSDYARVWASRASAELTGIGRGSTKRTQNFYLKRIRSRLRRAFRSNKAKVRFERFDPLNS